MLSAAAQSYHPLLETFIVLALSTGARKSEMLNLTWDDVDLKEGRATLTDTKNSETRILTLRGRFLDLLRELNGKRIVGVNLIFAGQKGS